MAVATELLQGRYSYAHWRLEDVRRKIATLLFPDNKWQRGKKLEKPGRTRLRWTRQGDSYISDIEQPGNKVIRVVHGERRDNGGDGIKHDKNEP